MKPRDLGLGLLVMVIWGLNFAVAKVSVGEFPPIFFCAIRFSIVSLVLIWFARLPRRVLPRVLLASATMGAGHYAIFFTALKYTDASTAVIALQLQVPFAALLASFLFGDSLGWVRAVGMAVAFAGVVVLMGAPNVGDDPLPVMLVLLSGLVWAWGNVEVKRIGPVDSFSLNAIVSAMSVPQLFAYSLLLEEGQIASLSTASWLGWGGLAYMVLLVTMFSYWQWYRLVTRYDVNQTMPLTLLLPLFGVLSGVLLLGESVSIPLAVGGILTVAGVAVVQAGALRRPRATAAGKGFDSAPPRPPE